MTPENPGQLNYVITSLCDEYIGNEGLSYASINEVIGVLECAKLELYRRIAVPYENAKLEENGDVYSDEHVE
jgi:hypothetical protein